METIVVDRVIPATPRGPRSTQSRIAFRPRFTSPTYSGSHGFCMLWKLRLNMMLTLANVSPSVKAASASETSCVAVAVKVPR